MCLEAEGWLLCILGLVRGEEIVLCLVAKKTERKEFAYLLIIISLHF